MCIYCMFYCLLSVCIVSGAAWNEYNDSQYRSFASQLVSDITSPSTGAVYFVLFLVTTIHTNIYIRYT